MGIFRSRLIRQQRQPFSHTGGTGPPGVCGARHAGCPKGRPHALSPQAKATGWGGGTRTNEVALGVRQKNVQALWLVVLKGKDAGRTAKEKKPDSEGVSRSRSQDEGSEGQTEPKFSRASLPRPARRYRPENLKSPAP